MAIIKFLYNNLWDDGAITKSSEAAGFPATNTQQRWKTRCWRSETDTEEWIKVDLGAGTHAIKAFVIKNHNFTSAATLKIQGHTDDAWGVGVPTVDEDLTGLITADTIVFFWSSNQDLRWWRVYIDDGDNPEEYVKIGRIFLGSYFEPSRNYRSHTVGLMDPSGIKHSTGGQFSANEKTHYKTISWGFRGITEADVDSFEAVYDEVGRSKSYFICQDSADDAPYTVTYYVRNTSEWEFPLIKPGMTLRNGTITVETLR